MEQAKAMHEKLALIHGASSGLYFHELSKFINGSLMLKQGHIIKIPMELDIDLLDGTTKDVRAVMPPFIYENNMVPMMVFVDKALFNNSTLGMIPLDKTKAVLLKLKELAKTDDEVRLLLDDINPGWDQNGQ